MLQSHRPHTVTYWHVVAQRPTQRGFWQLRLPFRGLASRAAYHCYRSEADKWNDPGCSRLQAWYQHLWTAPVCMWNHSRCQRTSWTLLQEKCSKASKTFTYEWHYMASSQTGSNPSGEGTSRLINGWEKTWWATLIPWVRGKPGLAWDVTVPDTFAKSHLQNTATQACAAADTAADNKVTKYAHLATTHMFVSISLETGGSWNVQAVEFVQDLGKRISEVTNESMETQFLFQRLSMAVQRGNSIAFKSTFPADNFWRSCSKRT